MTKKCAFTRSELEATAAVLCRGGVVIAPTDTVYGLLCHPDFPSAAERIRQLKQRDRAKPFQKLVASVTAVWADGAVPSAQAQRCAAFWPGALTLVLDTQDGRTEGYRVPNMTLLRQLLELCGGVLCATSVNISGEPAATAVTEIPEAICSSVDVLLDGGVIPAAEASAVIRITPQDEVSVLRHGALVPKMFP